MKKIILLTIFLFSFSFFSVKAEENQNFTNKNIPNITQEQKLEIYNEIKLQKNWSTHNIIISLILWLLYWYAYYSTISKVKKKYMPIDTKSFTIFWLTSWWMVLINWFIPGSIVYFESFCLALIAVFLHKNNVAKNKIYKK